ncbi:predicted protein [Naegleria gruberi]|uniref:Predicted protein n=1 Tax=Naegleria gruberi TaxID=5762 RepID=D2VQP9_NAEGR|nr:uncharacterized protein NAEGRDRAFT_71304 [Naegleria gruberi]EFC40910.1 predicted protein [Naegleria gruberi]|eukprot:XP_002673654.1 predicted protein [Naegleria gruberi strain NEG-M]
MQRVGRASWVRSAHTTFFIIFLLVLFLIQVNCHTSSLIDLKESYRPVYANQSQCMVKPFDDPIRFEWSLECQNVTCNNLKIGLSKMSPTLCLAIQLFSDDDWIFEHLNNTDNYKMNVGKHVMSDNVRYRLFCYYQNMGALDFEVPPRAFCLTRNGSEYSTNCTDGYANEKLDELIGESYWNFTRRKQFHQYSWKMTNLTVEIPIKLDQSNQTGLQMHVMLIDLYSYPQKFELRFIGNPYYIIPLITNYSMSEFSNRTWDPQCDDLTYNSRPQYYIWKLIAISIGLVDFSTVLILLICRRKHRIIQSRFIIPYFTSCMYILQGITNIFLNVFYYDPEWDALIEELVLIVVMSLHLLQGMRYYISRLMYSRFYSKRDGILMKILLSKVYFLIAIISVLILEAIVVAVIMTNLPYVDMVDFYTYFSIICGISYLILLGIGMTVHIIVNFKFARKLKSAKQIFRWFFLHDDSFGYNGEFLVFVVIYILAGLFFLLSSLSGGYLTSTLYVSTRPISKLYLNNGFGYALYGCGKILFTVGYSLQLWFLVIMTFFKKEKEKTDIQQLKEEMDIFFSKSFNDGSVCIEIMKRFLVLEFKLELLEIYIFLSQHPKSTLMDLIQKYPQNYFAIVRYFKKSNLDSNYQECYLESTELLVEAFIRLKLTVIYEKEYLERMKEEIQFVLECIK